MQNPQISPQDKKDLEKFVKFLCLKSAQVIVQGRLGKTISSNCSPLPTGAEWFNLAIKDYPEIQKEAKYALLEGNPTVDSSFVIEISLRTSDCESLVLEVWSLSSVKKFEEVRVHHTVYNRMSLLLKSLMCVSRATPAYKLSRTQGSEYVICFRVYKAKIDLSGLGEGFKTLRVGSIGTPTGTIVLSAAFRTAENLHVSTKKLAPGTGGPILVSHDHFYSPNNTTSPARPCCTLKSRLMSRGDLEASSQSPRGPVESPSYGVLPTSFSTSPSERSYSEMLRMRQSGEQGATFSLGTPPTMRSETRVGSSSPQLSGSHRRFSDVNKRTPLAEGNESYSRVKHSQNKKFAHSHSEQNMGRVNDPYKQAIRSPQHPNLEGSGFHPGSGHSATSSQRSKVVISSGNGSLTSTLTDGTNTFKPITENIPCSNHSRTKLQNKHHSSVPMAIYSSHHSSGTTDSVTTLKSNSPSMARVGFPENSETTAHLTHVPPSHNLSSPIKSSPHHKAPTEKLVMPSPGAFVSNSKTAVRAYNTLTGISDAQKLPFQELIKGENLKDDGTNSQRKNKKSPGGSSSSDTSPESGKEKSSSRLSSQSSMSSDHSSDGSPGHFPPLPPPEDEFVMVNLNPAFGKSDSASDLGTFYRECENAPDLVMFQENNGTETQEALLDLTKQLEDYERDAEDFDNFVDELQSSLP